jgi:DNA-binding transcriptional ArsR family regulator
MFMETLECVGEPRRAAAILDPLRLRILRLAQAPASATEMARLLRLPRQKVNYHVRQLARARYLRRAGQRRKRNMIEQRFVATARGYVLSPAILGPVAADPGAVADKLSAGYLMALSAQLQADLGRVLEDAAAQRRRVATLSLSSELRFSSAQQRAAFATALTRAVVEVAARHSSAQGRPFRLLLGCYPLPREEKP